MSGNFQSFESDWGPISQSYGRKSYDFYECLDVERVYNSINLLQDARIQQYSILYELCSYEIVTSSIDIQVIIFNTPFIPNSLLLLPGRKNNSLLLGYNH